MDMGKELGDQGPPGVEAPEDSEKTMQGILEQIKTKLAPVVEGQQVIPKEEQLKHLGGYVVGGDDATWYPELWEWLHNNLQIKSVLDVGCGEGHSLKYFRDVIKIPRVFGIDGLPQGDLAIDVHDFSKGPWRPPWHAPPYDLVWCCEVVEHIDEEFLPNLLEAFKHGRWVAMTHAAPNQGGHHHVNCKDAQYWIGAMAAIGFAYDDLTTKCARIAASINVNPWNHFKRSGLCFRRYDDPLWKQQQKIEQTPAQTG